MYIVAGGRLRHGQHVEELCSGVKLCFDVVLGRQRGEGQGVGGATGNCPEAFFFVQLPVALG